MGGFINDINTFDSEFPRGYMDPSLRVTLEVAHQVRYLDCCFLRPKQIIIIINTGPHGLWDRLQRF